MPLIIKRNRKQPKNKRCSAVIAAAGLSSRMEGEDKLFANLLGIPVLARTLTAFERVSCISEIVVVTRAELLERVQRLCSEYGINKVTSIVTGGSDRTASVLSGALAVSKKSGLIAVHDGARPCVSGLIIEKAVKAAIKHSAATPGIPVTSTVKRAERGFITGTLDRENLYEIQTPQVFDAAVLKAALTNVKEKGISVTDDCAAAEILGMSICITEGSPENIKITTPSDMIIAEAILRAREERT